MPACSEEWVNNHVELEKQFFGLLSPTDMPERVLPDDVTVEIDGHSGHFDKSGGARNVEAMAAILRRELIPGSDSAVKGHETDRVEVGCIRVSNSKAKGKFDLFRSRSLPQLYQTEINYPDDFHAGILFFLDQDDSLINAVKMTGG